MIFVHWYGSTNLSLILGGILGALKHETIWTTFHAGVLGAALVAGEVLVGVDYGSVLNWGRFRLSAEKHARDFYCSISIY